MAGSFVNSNPDYVVQQAVLHHLRYGAQTEIRLGAAALNSLEMQTVVMREYERLLLRLSAEIQAQRLDTKVYRDSKICQFDAPDTWFDHLRVDFRNYQVTRAVSVCPVVRWYAQALALILWVLGTPNWKTHERTVTTEVEVAADALFPESTIMVQHDYLGKPVVVEHLVRKETR
jgi:hypothetical protein